VSACDLEQKEYASKNHNHDGRYANSSHSHSVSELPTADSYSGGGNSGRLPRLNSTGRITAGLAEQSVKPPLRFTRSSVSAAASDNTKDTNCESEFGSEYAAGSNFDLAFYGGRATGQNLSVAGVTTCWTQSNNSQAHNIMTTSTACSSPRLLCVLKRAPIRVTRSTLSTGATNSDIDSLCTSAFGSAYEAGTTEDLMSYAKSTGVNVWVHGPNIRTLSLNLSWYSFDIGAGSSPAPVMCILGDD